ncbi:MAG: hypothetical protein AAB296_08775 [Candidatus Desantisbacteria bacterium]
MLNVKACLFVVLLPYETERERDDEISLAVLSHFWMNVLWLMGIQIDKYPVDAFT